MSALATLAKFIGIMPKAETPEEDSLQKLILGRPMQAGWFALLGERVPVLLPTDFWERLEQEGLELTVHLEEKPEVQAEELN